MFMLGAFLQKAGMIDGFSAGLWSVVQNVPRAVATVPALWLILALFVGFLGAVALMCVLFVGKGASHDS